MRRWGWLVGVALLWPSVALAQSRTIHDHPGRFTANVGDVGATLTQIVAAPTGGQSVYVTSVILISSTATAGSFSLVSGTGTNCATGPVGVLPQPGVASPTSQLPYPANTAGQPLVIFLPQPIKLPASAALCVLGVATNLARGAVVGFVAP